MFLVPLVNELYLGPIWRIRASRSGLPQGSSFPRWNRDRIFDDCGSSPKAFNAATVLLCFVFFSFPLSFSPHSLAPFFFLSFFFPPLSLFTSRYAFSRVIFYPNWPAFRTILSLLRELILAPIMIPLRFCYSGSPSPEDDDCASRAPPVSAIRHDTDSSEFSSFLLRQPFDSHAFASLNRKAVAALACIH
jgi:hypothetical protein